MTSKEMVKASDILSPFTPTDAEDATLGALLLERDALSSVIDILQPESFYKKANQKIYQSILELFDRSEPIDLITVVNNLRSNGELESVGGAYYITELTTKVSSAANIKYHAHIIKEGAIRLSVYTDFKKLLDQSKDADIHDVIKKATTLINNLNDVAYSKNKESAFEDRLESLLFNKDLIVADPFPIISIDGGVISSPGNIAYIKGPSKSGKSGVLSAIIAGAVCKEGFITDTCGITIAQNYNRKLVLHMDTEQSTSNFYKSVRNILRRCEINNTPEFFKSILVRELSIEERKKALQTTLEKYANQFGGVHLIVIDGIADFVSSVNDEEECNAVVSLFEKLSIQYDCPIVTIVHLNPSSESKGRGHLDSQLERKAESVLTIKMDKTTKVSTLSCTYLRNAGNVPDIEFYYNTEKGYHTLCECSTKESKDTIRMNEIRLAYQAVLQDGQRIVSYKELVNIIAEQESVSAPTAKRRIAEMKTLEILENANDTNGGLRYIKHGK